MTWRSFILIVLVLWGLWRSEELHDNGNNHSGSDGGSNVETNNTSGSQKLVNV